MKRIITSLALLTLTTTLSHSMLGEIMGKTGRRISPSAKYLLVLSKNFSETIESSEIFDSETERLLLYSIKGNSDVLKRSETVLKDSNYTINALKNKFPDDPYLKKLASQSDNNIASVRKILNESIEDEKEIREIILLNPTNEK